MDQELASAAEAANEPVPRLPVGGLVIEALARRDFALLAGCLDRDVRLRALLPRGPVELAGRDEVAGWFRSAFGTRAVSSWPTARSPTSGQRLYLRWRVSLATAGPSGPCHPVEQHVFAEGGDRISALDLLCPGFVPHPDSAAKGRMPCRGRQ